LEQFNEQPLFDGCWADTGFVEVGVETLQRGDLLLMAVGTGGLSHCGVYLDDQLMLHHLTGRLSSRDVFGGYYQKATGRCLRHSSRMN
jgi:cell wall-associated NlpC family hydrolase